MDRQKLLKWLLWTTIVGILCICVLGRPSPSQAAPFTWAYTSTPPSQTPTVLAELKAVLAQGAAAATATATPTTTPTAPTDAPPVTTAPPPFVASSIVGQPLRVAIAAIAQNMPGTTIRPYQQGTSLPPGTYDSKRVNVAYDPPTMAVTAVSTG